MIEGMSVQDFTESKIMLIRAQKVAENHAGTTRERASGFMPTSPVFTGPRLVLHPQPFQVMYSCHLTSGVVVTAFDCVFGTNQIESGLCAQATCSPCPFP